MSTTQAIFTIGYEGRTIQDLLSALTRAQVKLVVDTRHRASSRKRGFARTALEATLRANGIDYIHRRELGTPPELMEDLRRAGAYDLGVYADHIDARGETLDKVAEEVEGAAAAMFCFEQDPRVCHRSVVADRVARRLTGTVIHL